MSTPPESLPHVLFRPAKFRVLPNLDRVQTRFMRKVANLWLGKGNSTLPVDALIKNLRKALEDDATAARVLQTLREPERAILAAYARYGGTVNGAVIRMDLLTRGLVEKVVTESYGMTWSRWKTKPLDKLAEQWALLPVHGLPGEYHFGYGYGTETERAFPNFSLQAGLAKKVPRAGPPRWSVPATKESVVALGRRSSAEVALDLARVFSFVAGRGQTKLKKSGEISVPSLRTLAKAVPFPEDRDFPLPDPQGFYFELLHQTGAIRIEGEQARADPAGATKLFTLSTAWQAHQWARSWLTAQYWVDGLGVQDAGDSPYQQEPADNALGTCRQVLAWALACLAQVAPAGGDEGPWFELEDLLTALHDLQGELRTPGYTWSGYAWDPELTQAKNKEKKQGKDRQLAYWFHQEGGWYANAVMVTLATLGLIECGRMGAGKSPRWCFRFTPVGRAVFGAPEVPPPPALDEARFLVLQPNFDVVAYLDRADAASAGTLGRLAETDSARTGSVQTFRITRNSLYQAQESGITPAQIVDFFRRHNQGEVPANVLRSIGDWSAQRESLVIRSGVILLAFPDAAARDAYLAGNPGSACGERFVTLPEKGRVKPHLPKALVSDHERGQFRRTLAVDEYGQIHTSEPYDLLQLARLRRIARPTASGWEITAETIRRAAAAGVKGNQTFRWLDQHLREPMPDLLAYAIEAWQGKPVRLEFADAVLLHVPDEQEFWALGHSRRLQPFFLGSPGPGWLAVRKEGRKQLAALLAELGFTVDPELTLGAVPGPDEP
jgi:hypothetical protein